MLQDQFPEPAPASQLPDLRAASLPSTPGADIALSANSPTTNRQSSNPLGLNTLPIPFDRIRAEHLVPAAEQLIVETKKSIDKIIHQPAPRTFENTLMAYDGLHIKLEYFRKVTNFIEQLATTPEIRTAYNEAQEKISACTAEIGLSDDLWKAIRDYADTDEAKNLTGSRKYFLEQVIESFKGDGADLPRDKKTRLLQIERELTTLTAAFLQNVVDATDAYEFTTTDKQLLRGLPQMALDQAREEAKSRGVEGWCLTLKESSSDWVLACADDESLREKIYRAYHSRCNGGRFDNREIVEQILTLRREMADILGKKNFAELITADNMAETPEGVKEFLHTVLDGIRPKFELEHEELRNLKRSLLNDSDAELHPWDIDYYEQKLRESKLSLDKESLREFLPYEQAVSGVFEVAQRVYGISIRRSEGLPTWHESVESYEMLDRDGAHLGTFYLDFFSRPGKSNGVWMDAFVAGPTGDSPSIGAICGNAAPPAAGDPALLSHPDVELLFHEFGHLFHHFLSKVELASHTGLEAVRDFIELPSQIMENWAWEREVLDLICAHYKTHTSPPEENLQQLLSSKNFRMAATYTTDAGNALLDIILHSDYDPARDGDIVSYSRKFLEPHIGCTLPSDFASILHFDHLFGEPRGYAAGYYVYLWAEVLASSAFQLFKQRGIFDQEIGTRFRSRIIEPGASAEATSLYRDFAGDLPGVDTFLQLKELKADHTNPAKNDKTM